LTAVAWHPEGHTLVTSAYDNTLRFWDAETIEPKRTVLFFGDGTSATFTAAGQIEQGDLSSLDDSLVYLVETEEGAIQLLSPGEFERRFQEAGLNRAGGD
jgi:WD40 repeat protein